MLLFKLVLICSTYLPNILTHTPATLRALANVHSQRARFIANALNLRALTHYNMARARARQPLREHRVVRDSKKNAQDIVEENGYDPEIYQADFYQGASSEGCENLQNPGYFAEEGVEFDLQPDYACLTEDLNENVEPVGDFLDVIDGDIDGLSSNQDVTLATDENNRDMSDFSQDFISTPEANDGTEASYATMDRTEPGYTPSSDDVVRVSFIIRDDPNQASTEQYSTLTPVTLLHDDSEGISEEDSLPGAGITSDVPQQDSDYERSAHFRPISHGHTHTHTFTHFRDRRPLHQVIQIPPAHIIAPGVQVDPTLFPTQFIQPAGLHPTLNIHVNQNQNSAGPQVFPQPGLNPSAIYTDGQSGFGFVQPGQHGFGHNSGTSATQTQTINTQILPNTPQVVSKLGGTTVHQSQAIQTHASVPPSNSLVTGGSSATQSQTINQGGVARDAAEDAKTAQMITQPENPDNEQLGSFLDTFHMETPVSPKYFDPNEPRNFKPLVNYIENHQGSINRFLHPIPNTKHPYVDSVVGHSNNKPNLGHNMPSITSASGYKAHPPGPRHENEKVGTFNLANILPGNFEELNPGYQREYINQYLETEQKNAHKLLEQVDDDYRHHMDDISAFINNGHQQQDIGPSYGRPGSSSKQVDDKGISETLTKLIEDDPGVHDTVGMGPDKNSNLGYIFHVPERRYSDYYQRLARSTNEATMAKLDHLLIEEKKLINELKKDAKHDEDLMMIGYIGDSLIDDLKERVGNSKRSRRSLPGRGHSLPLTSLIDDPQTKFDVPRTLDNLGAVAKEAFEHETAPLYHVRNALGSAQNAMIAAIKIPTKNFLLPCDYEIINTHGGDAKVGDINPSLYGDQGRGDDKMDTFQKMGSAIRESVVSGKEALTHVTNAANHARSAFRSTAHLTPKLTVKPIPFASREPKQITTLITPRIFEITQDRGGLLGKPQADYVRLGDIFDAVAVSNPDTNGVELEKITIDPQRHMSLALPNSRGMPKPSNVLQSFLDTVRVEDVKDMDGSADFVGSTLESLENAKETVGASSLKDFFTKIKYDLQQVLRSTNAERKIKVKKVMINKGNKQPEKGLEKHRTQLNYRVGLAPNSRSQPALQRGQPIVNTSKNQPGSDQEIVGMGIWPDNILKPFMGQATYTQRKQFMRENNNEGRDAVLGMDQRRTDSNLGQILGAINPMMFERLFNETLPEGSDKVSPHSVFHHHHHGHSHGHHNTDDSEEVGTSMIMQGQILKPFMGHGSAKVKQDFFDKYTQHSATEKFYIEDASQESNAEYKKPQLQEGEAEEYRQ